jgi:RNA polymerase sigma-70 factor (ECF subfamily)
MAIGDKDFFVSRPTSHRQFATTHWSVVLAARDGSPEQAARAWERLCTSYWYPLYAYLRRTGHAPHDAQDFTQSFLARMIERRDLASVVRERGKFRSFLLGLLKHFLSDEWKRASAQKRGGGQQLVSIDEEAAESKYRIDPAHHTTPDVEFDRQWGFTVLERVLERLRKSYEERERGDLFAALQPALGGGVTMKYADIAGALGVSENTVKVAAHRLRKEFGEILRDEIAQTVSDEREIDEEIRQLIMLTNS